MSDTASLFSLFISSFLAATLLPGGSEAALFAVIKAYPESLWYALILASIGNTLGGMVTFGMGWMLPQRMGDSKIIKSHQDLPQEKFKAAYSSHVQDQHLMPVDKIRLRHDGTEPTSAREASTHPHTQLSNFDRNVLRMRRYGTPALLLAWAPMIGDALCMKAGWLRLNPWQALFFYSDR